MSRLKLRTTVELFLFLTILFFAFFVTQTNLIQFIAASNLAVRVILSFISGIFYTSIFTAALSLPLLIQTANQDFFWQTAVLAGLGAVLGDLLIFSFVKFVIIEHLVALMRKSFKTELFQETQGFLKLILIFSGALIIASPLPDELGILLMGIVKINTPLFILISYALNTLGILTFVAFIRI